MPLSETATQLAASSHNPPSPSDYHLDACHALVTSERMIVRSRAVIEQVNSRPVSPASDISSRPPSPTSIVGTELAASGVFLGVPPSAVLPGAPSRHKSMYYESLIYQVNDTFRFNTLRTFRQFSSHLGWRYSIQSPAIWSSHGKNPVLHTRLHRRRYSGR